MRCEKMRVKLSVLCLCLLCVFSGIGINSAAVPAAIVDSVAGAYESVISDTEIKDSYMQGETLSLGLVKMNIGGTLYDCDTFLLRPDGVTEYGNAFVLEQAGLYALRFQARHPGGVQTAKREFSVLRPFYKFTSGGTSRSTAEMTLDGMKVSLAEGESLTLNRTIDLASAKSLFELIKIRIEPQVRGVADFTIMDFKFTDVQNSNSYIKVRLQRNYWEGKDYGMYVLAGATNQIITGYDPYRVEIYRNDHLGTYLPTASFYGTAGFSDMFTVQYSNITQEVFCDGYWMMSLSDPYFFDNPWNGFTGGHVTVSISASGYEKSRQAYFTVISAGGIGLPESDASVRDIAVPAITVDCDEANLPAAVVGKPYRLFPASAVDDMDGIVQTECRVFRNYLKYNMFNVDSANGIFTPGEAGTYTLLYTAVDRAGNKAAKRIDITAVNAVYPLFVTAQSPIKSGLLGTPIPIASYSAGGGSGKPRVAVRVLFNGKDVPFSGGVFVPQYSGVYEVIYEAEDYIGSRAMYIYNFNAAPNSTPFLEEEPIFPRYFIKGKRYTIPAAQAISYAGGFPEMSDCDIGISAGGYTGSAAAGQSLKMDFDAAEITVTYKSKSFGLFQKSIPIIDVGVQGSLDLAKYFDCGSLVAAAATDNGIVFETHTNGAFTFIREILSEDLSLRFSVDNQKASFNVLSVTLTDSVNPAQSVKAVYRRNGSNTSFELRGRAAATLNDCGFTSQSRSNDFYLTLNEGMISPSANVSLAAKEYENGLAFKGFGSGKVYVTFVFGEVAGTASINVRNINGQPLSNANRDLIRPQYVLLGDYGGEAMLGETVTLANVMASDVLDPEITVEVSVLKPGGGFAAADNGTTLNKVAPASWRFTVSEYGTYTVRYTARDANNGLEMPRTYTIVCLDKIAPQITFGALDKTQYRAGKQIKIPDLTVTDNYTPQDKILFYIYITTPDGQNIRLPDGANAFTPAASGIYKIVGIAYDEAGNMGRSAIEISVAA